MTTIPWPGDGGGRDGPAVGRHDGRDDREPEPAAAARRASVPGRPGRSARRRGGPPRPACPGPVSRTSISRLVADLGRPRTVVVVPGGVCARTLASRLSRTWRRRSVSPDHLDRAGGPEPHRPLGPDGGRRCARRRRPARPARPAPCSMGTPSSSRASGEQVVDQAVHAGRLGPDARHDRAAGRRGAPSRPARRARRRPTRRRWGCATRGRRPRRTGAGAARTPAAAPRRRRGRRRRAGSARA